MYKALLNLHLRRRLLLAGIALSGFLLVDLAPAQAMPLEMRQEIFQLADAAGVLSSRSCRDSELADLAVITIARILNEAQRRKHLSTDQRNTYQTRSVVPKIRKVRQGLHTSLACRDAKRLVSEIRSR